MTETGGQEPAADSAAVPAPDPLQAWQALGVVNDWIQHAEAKTGAILAAASIIGGPLLRFAMDRHHSALATVAAAACGGFALVAGVCGALALAPRVRLRGRAAIPRALAFYAYTETISRRTWPTGDEVVKVLTGGPQPMAAYIAGQVQANIVVARRKAYWANCALLAFIICFASFIVLSLLEGIWL